MLHGWFCKTQGFASISIAVDKLPFIGISSLPDLQQVRAIAFFRDGKKLTMVK